MYEVIMGYIHKQQSRETNILKIKKNTGSASQTKLTVYIMYMPDIKFLFLFSGVYRNEK